MVNSAWNGEQEVHREGCGQGEPVGSLSSPRGKRGGHVFQGEDSTCTKTGSRKECCTVRVQQVWTIARVISEREGVDTAETRAGGPHPLGF